MINTLKDFVVRIVALDDLFYAYDVFEEECTEELRDQIYGLATIDSEEPFRSAMINMGFTTY